MTTAIGIDLGTTNSVVSTYSLACKTILNDAEKDCTPSVVTRTDDNKVVVGQAAKELQKLYSANTIVSVKRLLGRYIDDEEVQKFISENRYSYLITSESKTDPSVRVKFGSENYTPEQISAEILKYLRTFTAKKLQAEDLAAVVTVPAYFTDLQKFATRAACDLAGLKLLRLLPEPTAAAISFGRNDTFANGATLMVFDLGGGTFDISVLAIANGNFMEIGKGGDMWLGGDDIDQQIVEYVMTKASTDLKQDLKFLVGQLSHSDGMRFKIDLKEKVEAAKIKLSFENSANIDCFGILKDQNGNFVDIDLDLTRAEFDGQIQPWVQRIKDIATTVLRDINFTPALIDQVLMVGGSSLIPAFQNALKDIFGADKVTVHPRPMLAVSEGAAIMAHHTAAPVQDRPLHFMHTTAHDYYLQMAEGGKHLLIAKNSPLPISVSHRLKFKSTEQRLARLRILNLVEGVFEPVGEVWFHRENANDFLDSQNYAVENKEGFEFNFDFKVDPDNIIKVELSDASNQKSSYNLTRTGLELQLLQRVEKLLVSISLNSKKQSHALTLIDLSQIIVSTIGKISDPVTGVINHNTKIKAQNQINTLERLFLRGTDPALRYLFLLHAVEQTVALMSVQENDQFKMLLSQLRANIENLTDADLMASTIQTIHSRLEKLFGEFAFSLARSENAAGLIHAVNQAEAKRIRQKMQAAVAVYQTGDKEKAQNMLGEVEAFLAEMLDFPDQGGKSLSRDVEVVR